MVESGLMQAWDFFAWWQVFVNIIGDQVAGLITGVVGTIVLGIITLIKKNKIPISRIQPSKSQLLQRRFQ